MLTVTNSNSNIRSSSSLLLGNLKEKFVKDAELKKMKDRHTDQTKALHKELTFQT